MPWFKYRAYLHECTGSGEIYDTLLVPGTVALFPGIYLCEACGSEAVVSANARLPEGHGGIPVDHGILWRLVAFADSTPPRAQPPTAPG